LIRFVKLVLTYYITSDVNIMLSSYLTQAKLKQAIEI